MAPHKVFGWWNKFHLHFARRASLNSLKSFTPWLLGQHTSLHLTQAIFLYSPLFPHKKFLSTLYIFLTTLLGILKKRGKDESIELMRHIHPVNESCLCFQKDNFFTYLSMISLQVLLLLGLAPIRIPKYIKGKYNTLQFKTPANAFHLKVIHTNCTAYTLGKIQLKPLG